MKEKKKGGERKGAGRKPTADPKQPVTIFVETSIIEYLGGKEGVQFVCYGAIYGPVAVCGPVFSAPEFPDPAPSYVKKKFPPSDRKIKQKGVPLPDDYVKFSKVKAMKPDGTIIADVTQPAPVLKPQEQPKTKFEAAISETAQKAIREQIEAIRAEKIPKERDTPFGRKSWQIDQQKRIQDLQSKLS